MPADGLAVGQQCRDWFAEGPGELAVGARLAFVDLSTLGVERGTIDSPGAAMASGSGSAAIAFTSEPDSNSAASAADLKNSMVRFS